MKSPQLRAGLGSLILIVTVGLFVWYFRQHPSVLEEITRLRLPAIVLLIGLYLASLLPLVFILQLTLELCQTKLATKELVLLTIYSSLANFFGPLQSGPVFRAVYLQQRHGVKLKDYTLASLLYYGFLAFFSATFLLLGSQWWWVGAVVLLLVGVAGGAYLRRQLRLNGRIQLQLGTVIRLGLMTLAQVGWLALIYLVELRIVQQTVSLSQAISYAGAANFSLFVALTPGAIGIREAFLLASQQLHGLTSATVLAASVIDRAVYLLFLAVLLGVAVLTHARDRLGLNRARP